MSMWDGLLAVQVESHGSRWNFGPFAGMPAAMQFVSQHVWDTDNYHHKYVYLADPSQAEKWLNLRPDGDEDPGLFGIPPREQREPLEAALRAAIAREHGEPGEGPHGDGLYAHLDVHRPWRVQLKSEECWEDGCEHDRDRNGACVAPARHELWCRGCTPVYVSGGEWDGTPYDECRVDWPCSPVLAMCASFGVSLTGKATGGAR